MSMTLSNDAVSRSLAHETSNALTARLGGIASMEPGQQAAGSGWAVAVPFSGTAQGRMVVWFDEASALTCARRAIADSADPSDDAVVQMLSAVVAQAAGVVVTTSAGAGLLAGEPTARKSAAPAHADAYSLAFDDGVTFGLSIVVEVTPAQEPVAAAYEINDSRLAAVLEVDLPLVVRFGRAVMPLRAIAELSPGAIVDMGRSPDEPVELLVGERLIARGEVVIVGGNYGVRITELTSGRRATDLEARV